MSQGLYRCDYCEGVFAMPEIEEQPNQQLHHCPACWMVGDGWSYRYHRELTDAEIQLANWAVRTPRLPRLTKEKPGGAWCKLVVSYVALAAAVAWLCFQL